MIEDYFVNLENLISGFQHTLSFDLRKKIVNSSYGILSGKIYFRNFILDFVEVVRIQIMENQRRRSINIT